MKIVIWTIGKPHESYVKQGIEMFTKRINNYFKVEWDIIGGIKNPGKMSPDELKKAEAEYLLPKIQSGDYIIVLDERGNQLTSEGLANQIQTAANNSIKRLVFLIGGAYGTHQSIFEKANFNWSLSKLVFPHHLVRLILSEQLYRACTILKNENYHHQ